jgi:hypothetical protein
MALLPCEGSVVPRFAAVMDSDLARARTDAGYRQQLLTAHLEALIAEMHRRKRRADGRQATTATQLREAAELAVKLADLITQLEKARKK